MTSEPALLEEIQKLKSEIRFDLMQAQKGNIIDISKLPDRLLTLRNRVKDIDEEKRAPLTKALEDVLNVLDDLSKEIQHRYNEITDQIEILDSSFSDKKE